MTLRRRFWIAALGAGVLTAAGGSTLVAHHAFAAEFDADRPVRLRGKVTRLEWVNPHAWVHVQVTCAGAPANPADPVCFGKAKGATEVWMIEGGPPNTLFRRGITKDSLAIGTEIVVNGYQSKDRSLRANGRDITYPDGRKLFLGTSGTGAPNDGRNPSGSPR